jgi:hypothetical protein
MPRVPRRYSSIVKIVTRGFNRGSQFRNAKDTKKYWPKIDPAFVTIDRQIVKTPIAME